MFIPEVDNLRCFLAAARLLNFRSAARSVARSPAALGQRIRQLEDELGTKLFHRTTRAVVLTEAGLNLVPPARRALDAMTECARAVQGDVTTPIELVMGTRHEVGISWLVPMLQQLRDRHSKLTLHLYFGSGPDLVLRVRSLGIDCAVTSTRIIDTKLDAIRLHEERYVFVGQAQLLRERPLRNVQDAKRHTLLDTTEDLPLFRYWRDAPGAMDSIEFREVLRVGTIAAIRLLALEGQGVAVMPEFFVARDLRAGELVEICPEVAPLTDFLRLVFRADDPRRSLYTALATTMSSMQLQ
jgi:DNA-binding transcriptional LysR family regulator